jgi:hypothetical protein
MLPASIFVGKERRRKAMANRLDDSGKTLCPTHVSFADA